ncbi:phage holin family protein [Allostreptomyces psammosilenae]|uniref:Putative membrane protein n=1 Tax=Allostreptomyces psammosilenae TaxID=1892865 RepID=A0A852ZV13_9ACTN|nr:phage holin family protein [Allostreptomyces psammosilenae]NYI05447.1 putative membrane protein [Allostreptomyces psammosilenae]
MIGFLVKTLINAVAIWVAAWLLSGIRLSSDGTADTVITVILVALIFGVVNAVIKPLVRLLSLPLLLLSLGLLAFVINALMLMLTSWLSDQVGLAFHVDGFWTALLGSLIISAIAWVLDLVVGDR